MIPTYQRHTFWSDPSDGNDLEVLITVSGGDNEGFSDDFVHNFYGYLSCESRNMGCLETQSLH